MEPDRRPDRFGELTLAQFVDRLASAEPVPGGGSGSSVVAALGASLVAMVAALSTGRPRYADHARLHELAEPAARDLADGFLELADEDAEAYAAYAAALKLPKETDADRTHRAHEIRLAARGAAEVPMKIAEACVDLVQMAERLAGRSNRNASSDLNVAALLGEAAAKGAAANVLVNLPAIDDAEYAAACRERVAEILTEVAAATRATADGVADDRPLEPLDEEDLAGLVPLEPPTA